MGSRAVSEADKKFIADRMEELRLEFGKHIDIYCVLRHVSKSGMQRAISFFYIKDNQLLNLDYSIQKICGYKFNRNHGGLTVNGCGMDMGFSVVANLEYRLFGNTSCKILTSRWV